jgi:hypothetical protein
MFAMETRVAASASRRSRRRGSHHFLLDRFRVKRVVLGFWFLILVVSSVSRPNSACHAE